MDFVGDTRLNYADERFADVDLTGVEITGKEFEHCTFEKCRIVQCTFRQCRFIDCTFTSSLLSAVKFADSSHLETTFKACKAIGIDWTRGRTVRGLTFLDCDLSQSVFGDTKLPHLVMKDCVAKEVDFTGADCSKADFEGTDFERSVFHKTNLTEASFRRAFHYTVDFRSNILKKTKFSLPEAVSLLGALDIVLEN